MVTDGQSEPPELREASILSHHLKVLSFYLSKNKDLHANGEISTTFDTSKL